MRGESACDVDEGVAGSSGVGRDDSGVWTGKSHERSHSSSALAYAWDLGRCVLPRGSKGQQKYFQLKPKNIQGSIGMGDFQRENSGINNP